MALIRTGAHGPITVSRGRVECMVVLVLALALPIQSAPGQESGPWQGKKCAVVLTYDDALNVHLDNAVPLLDSLGFKGTFYLSGFYSSFRTRVREWTAVAKRGHELGNHTLYHPCEGKAPDRTWVKPEYDLGTYTVRRMVDEITMANTLLESIDGRTMRTFAYPCGEKNAGNGSYVDSLRGLFAGARGVRANMETMDRIDLFDIDSYMISGQSGTELIGLVQQAMAKQALLVFLFHGVGGEHSLNVGLGDHRELLYFLKAHDQEIWVAPLVDIAAYVKAHGGAAKKR